MDYPTKEEAVVKTKAYVKKNRGLLIVIGAMGLVIVLQRNQLIKLENFDLDEWKSEYTEGFKEGFKEAIQEYLAKRG